MKRNRNRAGFALPTVIITSIIMMIVLLSALTAASSVQASLKQNYFDRIARNAAESGSVYAAKCLISGDFTEGVDITPRTNCKGTVVAGRSAYVQITPEIKSTFAFRITSVGTETRTKIASITGKLEFYGKSGTLLSRTVENQLKQRFSLEQDEKEIRATQSTWYFGRRAGMDFKTTGSLATPIINPQPGAYAGEGSTTVNNGQGQLQFWSNGITIWDKAGNEMPNGTGLMGQNSATQAVAALPFDDQYKKIGVISNNSVDEGGGAKQLYFSLVDMDLNGGMGDVVATQKNKQLTSDLNYAYEGIGAMPSNSKGEFWVYAYHIANREIRRFRVGASGVISGSSPKLATTMTPQATNCTPGRIGYGTFNFSKDYTKMLLYTGAGKCSDGLGGRVYLYETNTTDGSLSLLSTWETKTADKYAPGYSADFSPSEKYVYVMQIYPGRLNRYSIENITNSAAIKSSEWSFTQDLTTAPTYSGDTPLATVNQSGGQVKRAPDGRMYIADQVYNYGKLTGVSNYTNIQCKMNVINNPDAPNPNDIDLVVGGINLPSGACSSFGLPQMATVFKPKIVLY